MKRNLIKKIGLRVAKLGLAGIISASALGCESNFNDRFISWLNDSHPATPSSQPIAQQTIQREQSTAREPIRKEQFSLQLVVCKEAYQDASGKLRVDGVDNKFPAGTVFWVACTYENCIGKSAELAVVDLQSKEEIRGGEVHIDKNPFSIKKRLFLKMPGKYALDSYLDRKYAKSYEFEITPYEFKVTPPVKEK